MELRLMRTIYLRTIYFVKWDFIFDFSAIILLVDQRLTIFKIYGITNELDLYYINLYTNSKKVSYALNFFLLSLFHFNREFSISQTIHATRYAGPAQFSIKQQVTLSFFSKLISHIYTSIWATGLFTISKSPINNMPMVTC